MTIENGLTLLGIIASAGIGYLVKYFFDKKSQFGSQNAEIKRDMYQGYVDLVIDFFDKTTTDKPAHRVQKEMYNFYKKCVLYASPKVINAYSDLMQFFYNNTHDKDNVDIVKTRTSLKKMTKVFRYMRKDIGLSNRKLGKDGELLFRAIITDYDEKIKPRKYESPKNLEAIKPDSEDVNENKKPVVVSKSTKKKSKPKKGRR